MVIDGVSLANLFFVMVGGGLGAGLRYVSGVLIFRMTGPGFPWGTVFVNIVGSFAMGVLIEVLARKAGLSEHWRLFVATGLLGGFTTFSSFSLDTVSLMERGETGLAALYVAGSVGVGILALFAGFLAVRALS